MMKFRHPAAVVLLSVCAMPAFADHEVIARGSVLFSNITSGPLVGVPASTPVELRFVVDHVPNVVTPGQVSEYGINFAQTRITVGSQVYHFTAAANPAVLLFQNNNELDSDSDGVETRPDVVPIEGTPYQTRFHAHDILGTIFDSALIEDNAGVYSVNQFHHLSWTVYNGIEGMLISLSAVEVSPGLPPCDSIDFNGDTLFPDTADIADFLTVFGGGACPTGTCGDIDFNNDELFPDIADIESLLRVFAGGGCHE